MTARMRHPSPFARDMHNLLLALGYRYDRRDGGHVVHVHDEHGIFVSSQTPSDSRRAWLQAMVELRRRHGDLDVLRKGTTRGENRDRNRSRRRGRRSSVVALESAPLAQPRSERPQTETWACSRTGCDVVIRPGRADYWRKVDAMRQNDGWCDRCWRDRVFYDERKAA